MRSGFGATVDFRASAARFIWHISRLFSENVRARILGQFGMCFGGRPRATGFIFDGRRDRPQMCLAPVFDQKIAYALMMSWCHTFPRVKDYIKPVGKCLLRLLSGNIA